MKKPWNLISEAVYSLATITDGITNMNICTYVTPISMHPKLYAIAVYHNSKTLQNIQQSDFAILQILEKDQAKIVNVLGKKSGLKYDKSAYLHKKKLVSSWNQMDVLHDCVAYIYLKKISCTTTGDHDLYLFEVITYKQNKSNNVLTTKDLSDLKIISI